MILSVPPSQMPHQAYLATKSVNAAVAEYKPATILQAGISFIPDADATASGQRAQILEHCLRLLCDAVIRYGGMVSKIDDGVAQCLFGLPTALENHAQRACCAALDARDALAAYGKQIKKDHGIVITAAVGIHSGMAAFAAAGEIGSEEDSPDDGIYHTALKLLAVAKAGSIVITAETEKLVREFFVCRRLAVSDQRAAVYELKQPTGLTTPIEASIARGLTHFTGREREAALLLEAFGQARGGSGQVVDIAGEAGIGKSRLALELRQALQSQPHHYLVGRCLTVGASTPYHPLLDILRSYLGFKEGEHEAALQRALKKKIASFGDADERMLPALQDLLMLNITDEAYRILSPPQKREAVFKAISDLLLGASRTKPLVLIVEDLHWIDQVSREFLAWFIPSMGTARILLLQLYRPEYVQPPPDVTFYRKIILEQLQEHDGLELLRALLGTEAIESRVQEIVRIRAGGNPLFIEELTRSLVEAGIIVHSGSTCRLAGTTAAIGVPATIQGIITARMDRIEEQLTCMLQAASVIGREFQRHILKAVTELDDERLKSGLVNLEGLGFIICTRLYPDPAYMFRHALIQDAAYNSLSQARRQALHERTGTAIEKLYAGRLEEYYELLAHHYLNAAKADKALVYLELANRKAIQSFSMEMAKSCFDQAMVLLDSLPDTAENRRRRIVLLVPQMQVFAMLVKISEYHELLSSHLPLADGCGDPGLIGAYYARLGACEAWHGHFEEDLKIRIKALELCEAVDNKAELPWVYHGFLWSYLILGELEKVLEIEPKCLQAAQDSFNLPLYVNFSLCTSMACCRLGRWDDAIQRGRQALQAAEKYADDSQISTAAYAVGASYLFQGDLERAAEFLELAISKARGPLDEMFARSFYALAQCKRGESEKGLSALQGFLNMSRVLSFRIGELLVGLWLGEGYLCAGETAQARLVLGELTALARRCKALYILGPALRLLGEAMLEPEPETARQYFEESIAMLQKVRAENDYAHALAGYGRYYLHTGDTAKGREHLKAALAIFERLGTLGEPHKIRQELSATAMT
jgi:tetratricopeptide (TPR) repeat protein/class 3 adenylate cyclase